MHKTKYFFKYEYLTLGALCSDNVHMYTSICYYTNTKPNNASYSKILISTELQGLLRNTIYRKPKLAQKQ